MLGLRISLFAFLLALTDSLWANQTAPNPRTARTSPAYNKAFTLLQSGQVAEALAEIDASLVKEPNNPSLHNLRGLLAARLRRRDEAEASFRQVIRLLPGSAMGYNNLGVLLSDSGQYEKATVLFRRALQAESRDFTALVGLGATLAAVQKYAEAAPYLRKAWAIHPGDFQTGYEWARVLRELKRSAEAQGVLQRLNPPEDSSLKIKLYMLSAVVAQDLGHKAAARRLYLQAYSLAPQSFEIYLGLVRAVLATGDRKSLAALTPPASLSAEQHFALGLLFASRGAYAEAIPQFDTTLQMEPESYSATYNLALAYKQAGQSQSAIAVIERALNQSATGELYNLLASLEEDSGRYVEAVRHYRQAVDLEPGSEQYYFDLGAEYLTHLTFEPALEVFRVAARKFPNSPRQHVGMGLAQFALRHHAEAAESFLNALEIDPSSPDAFAAWKALPNFVAVTDWTRIRPRLQQLVERYPENAQALYCYAAALFRHSVAANQVSNFDLVRSLLERAIRLRANFAEAYLEIASLFAVQKQYKRAAASFLAAIRLDPGSEQAHYQLGQTYRDLGQFDLAQGELARYAELSFRHREKLAQIRSTIRQFVLAQPGSVSVSSAKKAHP